MNTDEKKKILEKYGYNTVSYQSLMEGIQSFNVGSIEGFISYTVVKKTYIAIGDPLCSENNMFELTHAFRKYVWEKKGYCTFISVSSVFQKKLDIMGFGTLKIGEEAIFEIEKFTLLGKDMSDVRNMIRRAQKEGVSIRRLETPDINSLWDMEKLNSDWMSTKKVKGFSFLLKLTPFENFEDKIIFLAEKEGNIVGYLSAVPIYQRNGYYFEDIIRSNDAPLGTNQFLVYSSLEYLKEKGYSIASLGTSPLWNIQNEHQDKFRKTQKLLKFIYLHINSFYNFRWLYHFKKNLCPTSWEEKYVAFYPAKLRPRLFLSIAKAYNPKWVTGILVSKIGKTILKRVKKSS